MVYLHAMEFFSTMRVHAEVRVSWSNHRTRHLSWKTIKEMIQFELQIMVFKLINGLAPQYLIGLLVANFNSSLYKLRNTATDLKILNESSSNG